MPPLQVVDLWRLLIATLQSKNNGKNLRIEVDLDLDLARSTCTDHARREQKLNQLGPTYVLIMESQPIKNIDPYVATCLFRPTGTVVLLDLRSCGRYYYYRTCLNNRSRSNPSRFLLQWWI